MRLAPFFISFIQVVPAGASVAILKILARLCPLNKTISNATRYIRIGCFISSSLMPLSFFQQPVLKKITGFCQQYAGLLFRQGIDQC